MQPDPIVTKLCYQVNIGNFWGGVGVLGRQNRISFKFMGIETVQVHWVQRFIARLPEGTRSITEDVVSVKGGARSNPSLRIGPMRCCV